MCIDKSKIHIIFHLISFICLTHQSPFEFPVQIVNKTNGSFEWGFKVKNNESCVSLRECPTFSWMLNYKHIQNEVIQIDPKNIIDRLTEKRCIVGDHLSNNGITLDSKIACPSIIEERNNHRQNDGQIKEEKLDEFDCITNTGGDIGSILKTRLAIEKIDCKLEITHGPISEPLSGLKTIRFSGNAKIFKQIPTLETRLALHVTAHGNCCWKIYSNMGFKGNIQDIKPGDSVHPNHQPRSIKRLCC